MGFLERATRGWCGHGHDTKTRRGYSVIRELVAWQGCAGFVDSPGFGRVVCLRCLCAHFRSHSPRNAYVL